MEKFSDYYEELKSRVIETYFYCSTCGNVIGALACQDNTYEQATEHKCKYCGGEMINTEKEFGDIFEPYVQREKSDKKYRDMTMEEEVRLQFVYDNPKFDKSKHEMYRPLWEQEEAELVYQQNHAVYGTALNTPKCPTCQSTNITPISGLERGASVLTFGLFSKKINKSFKCGNCGYTW